MKRVGYGKSHKVKGSMTMGLAYPVMVDEMVPGDITRIKPEVFIQSVVPPTVQLTDNIKWKLEFIATPIRLVDDTFVRNITTTKDGTVRGDFKTWSLQDIKAFYGDLGISGAGQDTLNGETAVHSVIPAVWKEKANPGQVIHDSYFASNNGSYKYARMKAGAITEDYQWNCIMPYARKCDGNESKIRTAPFFAQGSLMDWLGLEPNGNIGINGLSRETGSQEFQFNTWFISAYYMACNFFHTNPEYQRYIAPLFDYVPSSNIYGGFASSRSWTTLHRYETLEEEFGNGFVEPRLSGRCINGLFIDNWTNDYFSNTTKTAQRGVAPVVPVSLTGGSLLPVGLDVGENHLNSVYITPDSPIPAHDRTGLYAYNDGTSAQGQAGVTKFTADARNLSAGFVISDLRSALALQHFQEDTQSVYKWSDWLQKVYGISPSDSTLDEPYFIGACTGYLSSDGVVSTSSTNGAELGEIGGKLGTFSSNNKMLTYRADEHCVLMAIMTIKPERNYESGVEKMFMRRNYLDMYFKYLTGIGNQAISLQEVCALPNPSSNGIYRQTNWGFTSRFEEFRHKRNRIVAKCRNDNMIIPAVKWSSNSVALDTYGTLSEYRDYEGSYSYDVPYLNTFHPYAIGDSYYASYFTVGLGGAGGNRGLRFTENNDTFLLCCPQLNDIFIDDTEDPFVVVVGFNMDTLSPIPAFTSPGVEYV